VPDLLFEDVLLARVEALRDHSESLELGADFPLHRVTLFLSYACNLRCPYCKTIARSPEELAARPEKRVTYTLAQFRRLLDGLGETVQHLHFTGGEASIVPGVVEMVAEARRRGVPHLSMTTNGTVSAARYVELVHAGLTELRVSIDAKDAALGARMTGSERAWSKSIAAVKTVAAARDAGAKVRLLVNTVVGNANRAELAGIVKFLLSLGPDDVKLITDVDARDGLPDFPEYGAVMRELGELMESLPPARYPLLRRKLKTVFARDSIGLEPTAPSRLGRSWRCYIPMTERTVDGVSYYPCSVYLREGGAPIGALTESAGEQRRKSAEWVRENDCREDPICQRYCLHCTRVFNDATNAARRTK
jgi:molybdenum cofactor biosynthesis enzyme MoaA